MNRLRNRSLPFFLAVVVLAACGGQDEDGPQLGAVQQDVAVAPQGTATTLDIANWNLEWWGDPNNGPTNETLQQSNVHDAIAGTDFDIWGLEEVVSNAAFNNLKAQLPGYTGFVSNDAVVTGGSASYSSTEQKVAILYKTSIASLVSARIILTANDFDFAGRPPMEVTLDVTLNGVTERRVFIVLHMKAFNDTASWQRRANASAALKSYLDSTYPSQKVFVIGDWNDDLDTSITPGQPSPYANFVADTARYGFPTRSLTSSTSSTTCNNPDPVDHQLTTNEQFAELVPGSVQVYRLDAQIASYCTTTTDHFPVLARYQVKGAAPAKVILNEILANEPGSSTAGEFVEIVNTGGTAVDIGGWQLWDATAMRHTFAAGTTLAAGKAIAVFASATAIPAGTPNAIGSSTGALSLANGGDTVSIRNAAGTVVDSFTYPASLAAQDGVSMNRNPDATAGASFVLHNTISTLASSPGKHANGAAF
ncbi:MAG TPA: lamin tail domain-containing protein [Myxococcales bacterium]|jgi:hypothetical protein|nr:lamin tail domain-containing protein [Myxococcales bacterium]